MSQKKPCVLIIMDGLGVAPACDSNAVTLANKPYLDSLITHFPVSTLLASGESVGLSWGEVGNSEVGHTALGIGKIIFQNLPRINRAIDDGSFFESEALVNAINHVKQNKSALHLIGLVSDGKVHSYNKHLYALLEFCHKNKIKNLYIHAITDGRDTLYNSAKGYLSQLQKVCEDLGVGKIATVSGRLYAMDRDNHWDRIEKAYLAMTEGRSEEYFTDPLEAIESSYNKKIYDEEFRPVVIGKAGKPTGLIQDNDAVIFFNYRADRARQLTSAFIKPEFDKFPRSLLKNLYFVTMTEYEKDLPAAVIFPPEKIVSSLGKIISDAGLSQFHIAETEKYAHVTYFFNGGQENAFLGEDREVIPSPRIASYAQKPEMSAVAVTKRLQKVIMQEKHDFLVVNFANPDMVGHTGDIEAAVKAVETVDWAVKQIVELTLSKGGKCVITADHGNCEEMRNLITGEISKDHSVNPVPCIIVSEDLRGKTNPDSQTIGTDLSLLTPMGLLIDVPATILKLMEIEIPKTMNGQPLF